MRSLQIGMANIVRDIERLEREARRECCYSVAAALVDARQSIEAAQLDTLAVQQADGTPPPALDWSGEFRRPASMPASPGKPLQQKETDMQQCCTLRPSNAQHGCAFAPLAGFRGKPRLKQRR